MEAELRKFTYFVIIKGRNTGLFTSFDVASAQVVDNPNAEYQAFNCQALAFGSYTARLKAIEKENEALDEMTQLMGQPDDSPRKCPPTVVTENGRRAPLCRWINCIPPSEVASGAYAVNLSMEELLQKVSYGASLPPPSYFRTELGVRDTGVMYAFSVILPGNPLGAGVHAKGRYNPLETDAKEDAAYNMLQKVLHTTD
ncbi:hypothetical protein HN51_046728 [Arachis hypogaea]|nr:uncharacterized protein DS421_12g359340 [Arachis hypogaea]